MSRSGTLFGLTALAAAIAYLVTVSSDAHPEQDQCSFGPISNEQYRELLSQARYQQATQWPVFIDDERKLQQLLTSQYKAMIADTDTAYKKIATMHAIFRGIGADFLGFNYYRTESAQSVYSKAAKDGGIVGFSYEFAVNKWALLYPLGRSAWLIGGLVGPSHSKIQGRPVPTDERKQGALYFIVHYPNPFDPIPDIWLPRPNPCPGVPDADIEPLFRTEAQPASAKRG